MSYLDHPCTLCGHQKLVHVETTCSHGTCTFKCRNSKATYGPPRVYASWDSQTGELIETLTKPGDWPFYASDKTCTCDACWDAYQEAQR